MRSTLTHSCQTVLATALFALVSLTPFETNATDLPANGYFLRVGAGYSPYARTDDRESGAGETNSGAVASALFGHVWNHTHSLELRWQNIYLDNVSQGTLGFSYTRYLVKRGPAPFFTIGFGLQRGPFLGAGQSTVKTDGGAALLFGTGLRFNNRLEAALDYSFGSSNRFFDNNNNYDFRHKQLAFSLRYVLWGE